MDISLLKESLGEELYAQAAEKLEGLAGLRLIATDDGSWLPKSRLDEEIAKRNELKKTVERLTGEAQACEALREENRRLAREGEEMRRGAQICQALAAAHARDPQVLERLIDRERLGEDGAGLLEQIAALREGCPYLFLEDAPVARGGFGGASYPRAAGMAGHGDVNGAIRAAAGRY